MKRFLFLFSLFALVQGHMQAQPKGDLKEVFNNGVFFFEYGEYKEALFNFMQVYMADSSNANINYKIAMCYLNIPGWESRSLPFFQRATRNIEGSYKDYSYTWKSAPLHTLFYLGRAYRMDNQLDRAMEVIEQFKNSPYYYDYNPNIVDEEVATIKRAVVLQEKPIQFKMTNAGDLINTKSDNYKAVITPDGLTMVYLSKQKLYDAIFITHRDELNAQWKKPKNISSEIESDGNLVPLSLSADGKQLLLLRKQENGSGDIFISKLDTLGWSKATLLPGSINSSFNESHASFNEDGTKIFYASDRKSNGGLDIFVSEIQEDGSWGAGENVGKEINSKLNENYPVALDNGKLLFFSSEGHYNMGNYDIFYSRLEANGKWSLPENLGFPINSTVDNVFYIPFDNGRRGIICLNIANGAGDLDIYEIVLENLR